MYNRVFRISIFAVITMLFSGCTILLPAHTNSNKKDSEKITLTMIKFIDVCEAKENSKTKTKFFTENTSTSPDFWKNYHKAYPNSTSSCTPQTIYMNVKEGECKISDGAEPTFAPLAIIASAAIGLATDYVQKQMEEEKTHYIAQYSGRLIDDSFWSYEKINKEMPCNLKGKSGSKQITADSWMQRYIGFKMIREIENSKIASDLTYGFLGSADGRFIQIKPLEFRSPYAKAKVLSNEWFTYIPPIPLLVKLFKFPKESIDIEIDISLDAYYWSNENKVFEGPKTIAAFKTKIDGYSMNETKMLSAYEGNLSNDAGWMLAPPLSDGLVPPLTAGKGGNFKLTVKVTESDTSEATKLLDISKEWVVKGSDELKKSLINNNF